MTELLGLAAGVTVVSTVFWIAYTLGFSDGAHAREQEEAERPEPTDRLVWRAVTESGQREPWMVTTRMDSGRYVRK